MFCGECGTQNPDTNQFCKNCGRPLRKPQQAPAAQPAAAPVPPVPAQPQAQPAYHPPPPAGYAPAASVPVSATPAKPPLNKALLALGIIGFILAIVSWFFYPYICGIAAVVLGGITIYRTERKAGIVGIIGVLAILVGLASMLVDNFYFVLFPPKEITFELLVALF